MTTIDFTRIRGTPKSRNDSFEALAVQLFCSTCQVPPGSTFISLRGDGGDGGVEAYFSALDGTIFCVQAKYFFNSVLPSFARLMTRCKQRSKIIRLYLNTGCISLSISQDESPLGDEAKAKQNVLRNGSAMWSQKQPIVVG